MWGYNGFGQLPARSPETTRLDSPTKVAERIALVGAGTRFTLVAPEEGELTGWGEMADGMPTLRARDGLRTIQAGTGFVLVLSAGFHEAASDPWAALVTWGELFF
jgi:alpha-tubulin suppressor-like RCC1 family protein